jgi:hypothetical protein
MGGSRAGKGGVERGAWSVKREAWEPPSLCQMFSLRISAASASPR